MVNSSETVMCFLFSAMIYHNALNKYNFGAQWVTYLRLPRTLSGVTSGLCGVGYMTPALYLWYIIEALYIATYLWRPTTARTMPTWFHRGRSPCFVGSASAVWLPYGFTHLENTLTHYGVVTHICVRKLSHYWFSLSDKGSCWAPKPVQRQNHDLNQWYLIVNYTVRNIFRKNSIWNKSLHSRKCT